MMTSLYSPPKTDHHKITKISFISRVTSLTEEDLTNLVEATIAAILDGGTFGWLHPPERLILERYFNGLLLVPERELFVARQEDGTICGAGLLAHPAAHSELHSPKTCISALFIAPYARNQGLGRALITALLDRACQRGAKIVDCELRETQKSAIKILLSLGFEHWGTHPYYAHINGKAIKGLYFSKRLPPKHQKHALHAIAAQEKIYSKTKPLFKIKRQPLKIYPAIDLKNGACVQLRQGKTEDTIYYLNSPLEQAQYFLEQGCNFIHLIDLNGAFSGSLSNIKAIEAILAQKNISLQLGGGIRDMKTIDYWLNSGVERVILGSSAVKDPELIRQAARAWPDKIYISIDIYRNRVAVEGWSEISEMTALELAQEMQNTHVAGIIFTDISHDGTMNGLNIQAIEDIANAISIPLIVRGGIGSLEHLEEFCALANKYPHIEGIIIGRALYEEAFSIREASRLLNNIS